MHEKEGSSIAAQVFHAVMSLGWHMLALTLITGFTYLFGHPLLEGPIWGNDSAYALSIISWIDRWFLELPLWYPLQGAGASSIVQYPYAAHLLAVIASRLTGLSIFAVFRLEQFLSIALTAYGVYLLVWLKIRSRIGAIIAGLAYPLSAAAWPWVTDVGLFAQAFSMIFFVPAFLLFEWYALTSAEKDGGSPHGVSRLALPAAAVAFAIMILTHGASAVVLAMTVLMYSSLVPILTSEKSVIVGRIRQALGRSIVGFAAGVGLAGFWVLPYMHLSQLANREGAAGEFALHQIPYLDLKALIGLGAPPPEWEMWALSLSGTVVVFAAAGFLISVKRNRICAAWGLIAIAFALFTAMPGLWPEFVGVFKKLWAYTYVRALIPTMVFVPALAGYAAHGLGTLVANAVVRPLERMSKAFGKKEPLRALSSVLRGAVASSVAIFVGYVGFVYMRLPNPAYPVYPGYGATVGPGFWPFDFSGGGPKWVRHPSFTLSSEGYVGADETIPVLAQLLGLDGQTRIDLTPYLGGILQLLPLYTDASTINIYAYGASLIHAAWGYQQGAFYSDEFGSVQEVEELARWFGVKYLFLNPVSDPMEKYETTKWPVVTLPEDLRALNLEIRKFYQPEPLATVSSRPAILVIGGHENDAYMQVFRVLNSGVVKYNEAFLVEGEHDIDFYSPEDLSKFDVIVLHGYGHRNPERAWEDLENFVRNGGSLFVDTGWQYRTPEWQAEVTPVVFPVTDLVWMTPDASQVLVVEDPLGDPVNTEGFGPLIWEGGPWGLSVPTKGLRDWALPVLSVGGNPVVAAGKYGEGRVVWSGMNIFAHLTTYESTGERSFLRNALMWLIEGKETAEYPSPAVIQNHPDKREFNIQGSIEPGSYLLWKEAFSPDWKAYAVSEGEKFDLPIYRAGPGMMLIPLPEGGTGNVKIELVYGFRLLGWTAKGLSLVSALALAASIAWPDRVYRMGRRLARRQKVRKKQGSVAWLPDLNSGVASMASSQSEWHGVSPEGDFSRQVTSSLRPQSGPKETGNAGLSYSGDSGFPPTSE